MKGCRPRWITADALSFYENEEHFSTRHPWLYLRARCCPSMCIVTWSTFSSVQVRPAPRFLRLYGLRFLNARSCDPDYQMIAIRQRLNSESWRHLSAPTIGQGVLWNSLSVHGIHRLANSRRQMLEIRELETVKGRRGPEEEVSLRQSAVRPQLSGASETRRRNG